MKAPSRERNCLSYWFPKLLADGIPVPTTFVIRTEAKLIELLDGKTPEGFEELVKNISDAGDEVGWPCFLRTGQGSGKHDWKNTCFLQNAAYIPTHISALVEWSEMVDFLGLPTNVWCVREMLPTEPTAVLPAYGDMPLVREVRGFVRNGEIVCWHDYWPEGAIREGIPQFRLNSAVIAKIVEESKMPREKMLDVFKLLQRVADAFVCDGAWSVDVLETSKGMYVTDMAEATDSYHWIGCPKAASFE